MTILTRHIVADGMILSRTRSVRLIPNGFQSASTTIRTTSEISTVLFPGAVVATYSAAVLVLRVHQPLSGMEPES